MNEQKKILRQILEENEDSLMLIMYGIETKINRLTLQRDNINEEIKTAINLKQYIKTRINSSYGQFTQSNINNENQSNRHQIPLQNNDVPMPHSDVPIETAEQELIKDVQTNNDNIMSMKRAKSTKQDQDMQKQVEALKGISTERPEQKKGIFNYFRN